MQFVFLALLVLWLLNTNFDLHRASYVGQEPGQTGSAAESYWFSCSMDIRGGNDHKTLKNTHTHTHTLKTFEEWGNGLARLNTNFILQTR